MTLCSRKRQDDEIENPTFKGSHNLPSSAPSFLETLASFLTYLGLYVRPSIDDLFRGSIVLVRPSKRVGLAGVVEVMSCGLTIARGSAAGSGLGRS